MNEEKGVVSGSNVERHLLVNLKDDTHIDRHVPVVNGLLMSNSQMVQIHVNLVMSY